MGRRSNPLSNRLKGTMNWPSNVSHPFLQEYCRHIFQHSLVATPHIRASTNGIWINLTLLNTTDHPKLKNPTLDFRGANLMEALGRMEVRTRQLTTHHPFYKKIFAKLPKTLIESHGTAHEALHIYRDTPIQLRINVISNPLQNADIMAQEIANSMKNNVPLARIFKTYLKSMS